jgi:hypothetical protein
MRAAALRLLIAFSLAGAISTPAWAQPLIQPQSSLLQQGIAEVREAQLRAQLDMANRQAVIQQNQLSALDSQIRSQQAFDNVRAQSYTPIVPPAVVGAVIDPGQLVSIPDDRLAASNARVRAVAADHH